MQFAYQLDPGSLGIKLQRIFCPLAIPAQVWPSNLNCCKSYLTLDPTVANMTFTLDLGSSLVKLVYELVCTSLVNLLNRLTIGLTQDLFSMDVQGIDPGSSLVKCRCIPATLDPRSIDDMQVANLPESAMDQGSSLF